MTVAVVIGDKDRESFTNQIPDEWIRATWEGMDSNDTGEAIVYPNYADRTVQVSGTFGTGGNVVIEGTIDGTNYVTLADVSGATLSFSSAGLKTIVDVPWKIRPRVTAGDGTTSITVSLAMRRNR